MKKCDVDELPVVGSNSSSELGVRPGIDIFVDAEGNIVLNETGMSVAPEWRKLPITRIPKRLRNIVPGAIGANNTSCYRLGAGPFTRGIVAAGLELRPDPGTSIVDHGVIAPIQVVPFEVYQSDLANTRGIWQIDEV